MSTWTFSGRKATYILETWWLTEKESVRMTEKMVSNANKARYFTEKCKRSIDWMQSTTAGSKEKGNEGFATGKKTNIGIFIKQNA